VENHTLQNKQTNTMVILHQNGNQEGKKSIKNTQNYKNTFSPILLGMTSLGHNKNPHSKPFQKIQRGPFLTCSSRLEEDQQAVKKITVKKIIPVS
jgi:hypothetical protein